MWAPYIFFIYMQIRIKKNHQTADSKTTKLINKHGNDYILIKYGHQHSYKRRYCLLVQSLSTNWKGWLDIRCIQTEEVKGGT